MSQSITCDECKGTGEITLLTSTERCRKCHGRGAVDQFELSTPTARDAVRERQFAARTESTVGTIGMVKVVGGNGTIGYRMPRAYALGEKLAKQQDDRVAAAMFRNPLLGEAWIDPQKEAAAAAEEIRIGEDAGNCDEDLRIAIRCRLPNGAVLLNLVRDPHLMLRITWSRGRAGRFVQRVSLRDLDVIGFQAIAERFVKAAMRNDLPPLESLLESLLPAISRELGIPKSMLTPP